MNFLQHFAPSRLCVEFFSRMYATFLLHHTTVKTHTPRFVRIDRCYRRHNICLCVIHKTLQALRFHVFNNFFNGYYGQASV